VIHRPRTPKVLLASILPGLAVSIVALHAWAGQAPGAGAGATPGGSNLRVEIPPVSLLEVAVPAPGDLLRLHELDLDVVAERPGAWARVLAWPGTLEALAGAGLGSRVLEADFGRAQAIENGAVPFGATGAPKPPRTANTVPPFGSGSLAGYYTLAEANALLDSLASHDAAGIVSSVRQVGISRQGRPIRALRIAKESLPDHSRPRVVLTALTHAREPEGMQAIVYFMECLIDGYGSDPNLTYLVDHREIWFVPCVNPDGYTLNENTFFGSGSYGMWRKNARDNDNNSVINSQDGVDLNRNFGYKWGFNNSGSSPSFSSETYRGPSAFSEPETQALRDLCGADSFRTANNYHTFGEYCLYPWGYNGHNAPDSTFAIRLADDLMQDAGYRYGVPADLLYSVNGDANDWMYGEQVLKPKVMAFTTEVGTQNDNFWPPASRILPLAQLHLRSNIALAYGAGTYVAAEDAQIVSGDGFLHPNGSAEVTLTLRSLGLDPTSGLVTVTASTSTPGITLTDNVSTFDPIAAGTTAVPAGGDRLAISAASSVASGTRVPLVLDIADGGGYAYRDTISIVVGQPLVVFADHGNAGLGNWTSTGGWGTQVVNADTVCSDSPSGNYAAGANASLTLNAALDLSGGTRAELLFNTRWDIESGYDFGRVEVSTNGGGTWTALAGRNTHPGHGTTGGYGGGTQTLGVPGYDATQRFEIPEIVDLTAYAGASNLRLRFRLTANGGLQRDGWYIDDVVVRVYPQDVTDVAGEAGAHWRSRLVSSGPNPFRGQARFVASFGAPMTFRAAVYSVDGRLVRVLAAGVASAGSHPLAWDGRRADGTRAASGTYLVKLDSAAGSSTRRIVLVH
jgi:hypothetical protein